MSDAKKFAMNALAVGGGSALAVLMLYYNLSGDREAKNAVDSGQDAAEAFLEDRHRRFSRDEQQKLDQARAEIKETRLFR
jgi:hypothetical protein